MNNIEEILKQFRNIAPDEAYSATSRRAILAMEPGRPRATWTARRTIFRIFETGAAVALTGFFIILITGGFSGSSLAPVQYSAIDPQSLRAEAQAIDIQIELANLNYSESSAALAISSSTVKPGAASVKPSLGAAALGVGSASVADTTSTTSSTVTINEALQGLSE